jgi:hypothetical protein
MLQKNEQVNDTEFNIIKALLYFRAGKRLDSAKELIPNLEDKYYTDKINGRIPKYEIKEDYKREDGWMDYASLGEQTGMSSGAIPTKIKRLVQIGIVHKKQIKWVHSKYKRKIRTKAVYRLKQSYSAILLISEVIRYRLSERGIELVGDLVKLYAKTPKSQTQYYLIKSDYWSLLPINVKLTWSHQMMQIALGDISTANMQYKTYEKLYKQLMEEKRRKSG